MKKYILTSVAFMMLVFCVAQSSNDLQLKIDSLTQQKLILAKQIDKLEEGIIQLSEERNQALIIEQKGLVYVFTKDGFLTNTEALDRINIKEGTYVIYINERDKYSCNVSYNGIIYRASKQYIKSLDEVIDSKRKQVIADSMAIVNAEAYIFKESGELLRKANDLSPFTYSPEGTEVLFVQKIIRKSAAYPDCKVIYNDTMVYAFSSSLVTKKAYSEIIEAKELSMQERIEKQRLAKQKEANRRQSIINKYGQKNGAKIIEKKIWLGMTKEMLKLSWGTPEDINRTVTTYSVREQWVYDNEYVYLEDGIVTSWQD